MSFSAEMKGFINAYTAGQKVNASRTDQDYKDALTEAQKKETESKYSPEQVEYEGKMQQLKLKAAQRALSSGAIHDQALRSQMATDQALRESLARPPQSTLAPPGAPVVGPAGPALNPQPQQPIPQNAISGDSVDGYAEGGAVPDGTDKLRRAMVANDATREPLWRGNAIELGRAQAADIEDDLEADRKGKRRDMNRRFLPGYAAGGVVPTTVDDEETEATPDDEGAEGGVLPTNAQPTSGATDISARRRTGPDGAGGGIDSTMSPQLRQDAIYSGLEYGRRSHGLTGGAVGRTGIAQELQRRAYIAGHGGLTDEEMDAAKKAVDPDGKMTESQRNMAALGSVWQFWNNKGDPDKAGRVAHQMLQHFNARAISYAAIAKHANDQGNMPLAAQAAVRAYQNVPDGKDMTVEPNPDGGYMVHMTGPKGEDIVNTLVSPEQFGSAVTGMVQGGFHKALLTAAGEHEQQQAQGRGQRSTGAVDAGAKPAAGSGAGDRKGVAELIGGEIKKRSDAWDTEQAKKPEKERQPAPEGYFSEVSDAATHLLKGNDLTHREAVNLGEQLVTPPSADPEKPTWVSKLNEETGKMDIRFKNGREVTMDPNVFAPFKKSYDERVAAASGQISKKMEEQDAADVPKKAMGYGVDDLKEGLGQAWKQAKESAGKDTEMITGAVAGPRTQRRVAGAGKALSDAFDWLKSKTPDRPAVDTLDERSGD